MNFYDKKYNSNIKIMSTVSYDYATQSLTVNKVVFDLNLYSVIEGMLDETQLINMKNKISRISVGDTEVSSFYNGESNEYSTLSVSDDIAVIDARVEMIKTILNDLKTVSKEVVRKLTTNTRMNVNVNTNVFMVDESTFTKFISLVTLVTKILTGVLVLQKVGQAQCELKPRKQDKLENLEKKIDKLKGFLQQTSNLLFMMDTVSPST